MEQESKRLNNKEYNTYDFVKSFISFLPNTICIFPMIIILSTATVVKTNFLAILIPKSLPTSVYKKFVGLGQIVGGLGCLSGSYASGQLFDKYGAIFVGRKGFITFSVCCLFHYMAMQT